MCCWGLPPLPGAGAQSLADSTSELKREFPLAANLESSRTNTGIPTNCDQWLDEFTFDDGSKVPSPPDGRNPSTGR